MSDRSKASGSNDDLPELSRLAQEFTTRFADSYERLVQGHQQLEHDRAQLEAEKELMRSVNVRADDVVELNVRGKHFSTTRATLCQADGCLLQYMFSGRWEEQLVRDASGRVYLEYNPYCFGKILDYLWSMQVSSDENPAPVPDVRAEDLPTFRVLVRYLGLEEQIYPELKRFNESLKTAEIIVGDGGLLAAQRAGKDAYQSVFGHGVFVNEAVEFTMRIEHLRNSYKWLMFGVIPHDYPATRNSHEKPGSFGWSTNGNTWIAGKSTRGFNNFKSGVLSEGSELLMTLDCRERYNTLRLQVLGSSTKYQLSDLPRNQWRLQVVLYGDRDEIRIMNIRKIPGSHILR